MGERGIRIWNVDARSNYWTQNWLVRKCKVLIVNFTRNHSLWSSVFLFLFYYLKGFDNDSTFASLPNIFMYYDTKPLTLGPKIPCRVLWLSETSVKFLDLVSPRRNKIECHQGYLLSSGVQLSCFWNIVEKLTFKTFVE